MTSFQIFVTRVLVVAIICVSTVVGFVQLTPSSATVHISGFGRHTTTRSTETYYNTFPSTTQVWARNDDDDNVNVNIIPDVDAATLTAVGFALIAFNFFVLGNLGDGGIAGLVATIGNLAQQ